MSPTIRSLLTSTLLVLVLAPIGLADGPFGIGGGGDGGLYDPDAFAETQREVEAPQPQGLYTRGDRSTWQRTYALHWAQANLGPRLRIHLAGGRLPNGAYSVVHPVYRGRDTEGAALVIAQIEEQVRGETWREWMRHRRALDEALATREAARRRGDRRAYEAAQRLIHKGNPEGYGGKQALIEASQRWIEKALLPTFPELDTRPRPTSPVPQSGAGSFGQSD